MRRMLKLCFPLMSVLFAALMVFKADAKLSGDGLFEYMMDSDDQIIVTRYLGEETTVTVPGVIDGYEVRELKFTFENNTQVKKVIVSEGIVRIGSNAFANCRSLERVVLPSTAESLGDYAFQYAGISKITLPKNVKEVGYGCFYGCESLRVVKSKSDSLLLAPLSFYYSGIKVFQSPQTPSNFSNTFSEPCYFTMNGLSTLVVLHPFLNAVYSLFDSQPLFLKAAFIVALAFVILLILALLYLFGRAIWAAVGLDAASNYRHYNERCKAVCEDAESESAFILPKLRFPFHAVMRAAAFFAAVILVILIWVMLTFLLSDKFAEPFRFGPNLRMALVALIALLILLAFYGVLAAAIVLYVRWRRAHPDRLVRVLSRSRRIRKEQLW